MTSIIQGQDLVKLLAGSGALFRRGFKRCAAAAELGAHGKPTAAKISPRTSTTLIRQPYFWSAARKSR